METAKKPMLKCKVCNHRFVTDHGQLTYYSHSDSSVWNKVIADTAEGCSLASTAAEINRHTVTVFHMRHKFLSFIEAENESAVLSETAETDEKYIHECHKGLVKADIDHEHKQIIIHSQPRKQLNPGLSDDKTCIFTAVQRQSRSYIHTMLICDLRAQYALHSTSLEEQPISDRTFSRFRERLYNYEQETGEDILKDEMKSISETFCRYLNINSSLKRMDSLMIAAHCKSMSRLEIIYTCVLNCVKLLKETGNELLIPEEMRHYLEADDLNQVIYYAKSEDVEPRLQKAIDEAKKMKEIMEDDEWHTFSQYQLLIRVLNEQANTDGSIKDKKEIKADSLQNPNDPDATYRYKAGKNHKGYVGNLVESIGENGASQITDFSYDPNTHSDQEYSREYIENHSDETAIADGAYGSVELQEAAKEKNIKLVTTALAGKEVDPVMAEYEFNEEGTEVIKCPMGNVPIGNSYYENTGMVRVSFKKSDCQHCPLRQNCKVKFQKKSAVVLVSSKMKSRAQ